MPFEIKVYQWPTFYPCLTCLFSEIKSCNNCSEEAVCHKDSGKNDGYYCPDWTPMVLD